MSFEELLKPLGGTFDAGSSGYWVGETVSALAREFSVGRAIINRAKKLPWPSSFESRTNHDAAGEMTFGLSAWSCSRA
jgi:hypothetical protein